MAEIIKHSHLIVQFNTRKTGENVHEKIEDKTLSKSTAIHLLQNSKHLKFYIDSFIVVVKRTHLKINNNEENFLFRCTLYV